MSDSHFDHGFVVGAMGWLSGMFTSIYMSGVADPEITPWVGGVFAAITAAVAIIFLIIGPTVDKPACDSSARGAR